MAFTEAQVKSLEAKLDGKHVRTRRVQDIVLTYVEGWHVIAEANRIFGYDAWDRETIATRCVWTGMANRQHSAAYTAKVRIAVRAGGSTIVREGCGSGEARGLTPGEAHDLALKAAETDATKRALTTFGNPFGLALYDRDLGGVRNRKALERSHCSNDRGPWLLRARDGKAEQSFDKPDDFAAALRNSLSQADTVELLFAIWEQNVRTVRALNKGSPAGERVETLVAHFKQCAANLAKAPSSPTPTEQVTPTSNECVRPKIDKSALTLSEPKRIRSKEHLRFVARQPCPHLRPEPIACAPRPLRATARSCAQSQRRIHRAALRHSPHRDPCHGRRTTLVAGSQDRPAQNGGRSLGTQPRWGSYGHGSRVSLSIRAVTDTTHWSVARARHSSKLIRLPTRAQS